MSRNLFVTKTFWLNAGIVGIVAILKYGLDQHPDPFITMGISAALNWLNRLQTETASHLL